MCTEVLGRFGPCGSLIESQVLSTERWHCDQACGALVGLAVADALGHWFELVDAAAMEGLKTMSTTQILDTLPIR